MKLLNRLLQILCGVYGHDDMVQNYQTVTVWKTRKDKIVRIVRPEHHCCDCDLNWVGRMQVYID